MSDGYGNHLLTGPDLFAYFGLGPAVRFSELRDALTQDHEEILFCLFGHNEGKGLKYLQP